MTGRAKHPGTKKDRPRGVEARLKRPYARTEKEPGALVCDDCGVVQHAGKWYWGAPPETEVEGGRCPACQRIRDRVPAGTLRVPAAFLDAGDELVHLIRNAEAAEKTEHPLERLIAIESSGDGLVVTTTGLHLARKIAHKLARRFHRKARLRYADDESRVEVDWE